MSTIVAIKPCLHCGGDKYFRNDICLTCARGAGTATGTATCAQETRKRKADPIHARGALTEKQLNRQHIVPLTSVKRAMCVGDANIAVDDYKAKLLAVERSIKEHQKTVRTLQRQLTKAKNSVTSAKSEKEVLTKKMGDVVELAKPDAVRVIEEVKKVSSRGKYGPASVELGRTFMTDMCKLLRCADNVQEAADGLIEVAKIIGASKLASLQEGAIKAIVSLKPNYTVEHLRALQEIYSPVLDDSPADAPWTVIAEAVDLAGDVGNANTLGMSVIAAANKMKSKTPTKSYRGAEVDKCPITEIMHPTLTIMRKFTNPCLAGASKPLENAMKAALAESVNSTVTAPDCSMPNEADIAQREGHTSLAAFLRDPTRTSISFDVGKSGRMAIHRVIDNKIGGYGKLYHESEGFGSARVLVVRKLGMESPATVSMKKERQEKHRVMLQALEAA